MKHRFMLLAMVAGLLVSCAGTDDASLDSGSGTAKPADGKYAVGFNAYASRSVTSTRAGYAGALDLTQLEQPQLNGGGFGVFAYYTDLKKYDQTYIPNFMYNQGVFKSGGNWQYTPVMYWPNEYGSDASSDDEDKVTFFAYAPYVHHSSAAGGVVEGDASWGITGFSRNTAAGDPLVKYIASFNPVQSVDLCWGVCDATSWNRIQGSSTQTMEKGLPWLDVEHPQGVDQRMTFTFKHALSQLNVQIDADADGLTHDTGKEIDSETRIYVRSISFTGIALKGALNLNNTVGGSKPQALWLDYAGTTDLPYGESVTVKDGRRDGREGASGAEATNETPSGLNDEIIQKDGASQGFTQPGVTHTAVNLFNSTDNEKCVYVIPTGEKMTVTIVYDVETRNPQLSTYISDGSTPGVSIENKISKTIDFSGGGLKCGNKYTLKLHLGMNSVKFDAAVADWDDGDQVNGSGWLPHNMAIDTPVTLNLGSNMTMAMTGGVGSPQTLTATTKPAGADVTWSTDNDHVTISPSGAGTRAATRVGQSGVGPCSSVTVTPVSKGTTIITATSAYGSAQCVVTVTDETTEEVTISLNKSETTIYATESETLVATTVPSPSTVTWVSSNTAAATVNSSGEVTALNPGLTYITATTPSGNTATCTVHVVASVKPKATTATVAAATGLTYGDTGSLVSVTGTAQNGTMQYAVTTTNSAPAAGEYSATVPTATSRNAGTYYVWYKAVADNNETHDDSDVASVSVTIAKADVSISYAQIVVNKLTNDVDFTNALNNAGGHSVTYSSSQTDVATVNVSSGLVHLVAAGTTTITASVAETANYKSASATYTLNVTNTPTPQASPTVSGWTGEENVSGVSGTKL